MKHLYYFFIKQPGYGWNDKAQKIIDWIDTKAYKPIWIRDERFTRQPDNGIRGCWITEDDATIFKLIFSRPHSDKIICEQDIQVTFGWDIDVNKFKSTYGL